MSKSRASLGGTFCSVRSLRPSASHFITPWRALTQFTLPRSVLISPAKGRAERGSCKRVTAPTAERRQRHLPQRALHRPRTVVAEHAHRLGAVPGGEGVGGEARVHQRHV